MDRRRLLGGLGLIGLSGCAGLPAGLAPRAASGAVSGAGTEPGLPFWNAIGPIAPVHATLERLFDITVCIRPFRAQGPRLDTETIGDTLIVHNYGHGGSGWSLSWGSGTIAVSKAMANSPHEVAVVGCGALGLTSAILAQRAGAKVTIYAKDLLPQTRSARATGTWSPDSRIALADRMAASFPALWEQMARTSFKEYRNFLGLPGSPVEFTDRYSLSDAAPGHPSPPPPPGTLEFADLGDRIRDISPHFTPVPAASNPFPTPYVRRSSQLVFNVADYGHTLMSDFLLAGGKFERREFHSPAELATLPQKVVINCPGYAARTLWKDETITPVRGQIAWLIPQPEVNYGFYYRGVSVLGRRDGIVVQTVAGGDMRGYGDDNETPDRAEAEQGVATVAELYRRWEKMRRG
ncbi:MAG: FAD-binding oxidoreductase [Proteobacteria bacterium]|nr:FAD-binding oxidoreductase [Pseudomonadota bacterium]